MVAKNRSGPEVRRPQRRGTVTKSGLRRPGQKHPHDEGLSGEAAVALPAALRIVASIVAPTTLLTGLLFYFGRLHAQGLTRYLRVQFTVFDFSVQDYLVRSADGLFVPLTVAAVVAVFSFWIHRLISTNLPIPLRAQLLRVLTPIAGITGLALVVVALVVASGWDVFAGFPEAGGLGLSVGVILVAFAVRLMRVRGRQERRSDAGPDNLLQGAAVAEWGAVFVVVAVGLFWAVNSYALGVGTTRGQQIERELGSSADVVVYSEKGLDLQVPGVREMVCSPPEASPEVAYRFRYEGLKLVLQSGDYYLFLPARWTRADGVALVIPRSESLRLEFLPPGRGTRAGC